MRFNELATKNIQKGIKEEQKCQKATIYVGELLANGMVPY